MSAVSLPPPGPPAAPDGFPGFSAAGPLGALLDVSLAALALLRPCYGPGGAEVVDFAFDYLNPAGQRRLGLPARPAATFLDHFPAARAPGAFAFCRGVWATGAAGRFGGSGPGNGAEPAFQATAQRHGDLLAVSFAGAGAGAGAGVGAADPGRSAEAALRPNAARFERFLDQTKAAICLLRGPDHRYEYVNPAYQQVFPGRALLGRPVADVHPRGVAQGILARLDHVYQSGEPHAGAEAPLTVTPPDGQPPYTLYFTFSYDAYQEDGQTVGVSIFAQDVTGAVLARRRADALQAEALAAAQRHGQERETLYQVFAQTPAAVLLLRGPAHRYEYYNAAYERLFPGRLPGSVADVLPAGAAARFVDLLDRVYETGELYAGTEVPLAVQAPGEPPREAYYNLTCQAFREDGQTAGVTLFAYDVTEQVLARRARDTQRQELEELFMQAPVPIVVGDGPDLVFQLVNPAYQRVFPGRVLLGRPFLEAMPELAATPVPGLLHRVYATGEPFVAQEMLLQMARHEGGPLEDIYWNFTYQARRNAQGAVDGVRVFAHEVTEQVLARQRATEQAQQAQALAQALTVTNRQLTRVNHDLDAFIYTASHDLKQPIANIEALLNILRQQLPADGPADALPPRLLGLMQAAVERFQLTIAQLTDVTKLQQAQALPAEAVDLAALVEDVRLDLAPVLAAAGARLAVDVAACPSLSFAPRNLRSIVYNLLSNAVKYRHPDRPPVVAVRAYRTAAAAVVEVQDNGLGLTEPQQAKLFGLFQRLHTHVEGSGLGLYMVKKIVDNAGGTVAVRSEPGVGTTFAVALPDGAD
ncbi:PAS domain-containing protein [Hymenobacter caeli]|uniref:histidine kinase n=1 Tax=Hymenobacter caeli TaxID=2735894 RepID=A0ABX2FL29_9BACT|nr:PAS domain-containing sensor histidine kinase [Hymenobacter caeli]NRT17207.1 signal transduction histidine kinase [Hymenobacter caeli]